MAGPHVLMVDDRPDLLAPLAKLLELDGHRVTLAATGEAAIQKAAEDLPDVIVADVDMPGMDGFELVRRLRSLRRTALVPILFLSGHGESPRKVQGLEAGGDDFISKPIEYPELKARIGAAIARTRRSLGANPLTGLPGNTAIEAAVSRRIQEADAFALAYVDIDFFKSYNDAYGFAKGDEALRLLGRVLLEAVSREGVAEDFVGHIGGDDFVLLTTPETLEPVADYAIREFDRQAPGYYSDADRAQGALRAPDRQGQVRTVPFLRLSIGATSTDRRRFKSYGQAAGVASEMKKFAKVQERQGSFLAMDQRTG